MNKMQMKEVSRCRKRLSHHSCSHSGPRDSQEKLQCVHMHTLSLTHTDILSTDKYTRYPKILE